MVAWGAAVLVAAALVATGCSAAARVAGTEEVAASFAREAAAGDWTAACTLLAPATRERVERAGPCAEALRAAALPDAGRAVASEVWGRQAQVRMTGDTLFLTETDAGWKVAAAGCRPRGEAPYDCAVEGP